MDVNVPLRGQNRMSVYGSLDREVLLVLRDGDGIRTPDGRWDIARASKKSKSSIRGVYYLVTLSSTDVRTRASEPQQEVSSE